MRVKAVKGNEKINGHPIRCYDNGGASMDRYTVAYMDMPERSNNLFSCVGMNAYPFDPQGFGQHSTCMVGKHLGKRIAFSSLPPDCQKLVRQDIQD